jgi:hypothetical protein
MNKHIVKHIGQTYQETTSNMPKIQPLKNFDLETQGFAHAIARVVAPDQTPLF